MTQPEKVILQKLCQCWFYLFNGRSNSHGLFYAEISSIYHWLIIIITKFFISIVLYNFFKFVSDKLFVQRNTVLNIIRSFPVDQSSFCYFKLWSLFINLFLSANN